VPGPVDIGGNLMASYNQAGDTVTLSQKPGTKLQAGSPIAAYFAVRVEDASVPIVNKIGNTSATITPLPSVSVGDYVWVDSNRDGVQDAGEPGIEGVTLTIVGPDGKPVTDVNGNPVGPVTTDQDGKYTFANLPALTGDQTYTVLIDQAASAASLQPYVPTEENVGTNPTVDSSTGQASSQAGQLQADGDRDPTLDFGFVSKTYAVGDYVWIDANGNGKQDSDEKPLAGVGVALLDGTGKVVATTTTDSAGRYLFDGLSAGTYQVRFTLTKEQAAAYRFTRADAGTHDAADSDADAGTGLTKRFTLDDSDQALTSTYDRALAATQGVDPTWDAGVVLISDGGSGSGHHGTSGTGASGGGGGGTDGDSGHGGDSVPHTQPLGDGLANTGTDVAGLLIVSMLALLGGGMLLIATRRRRAS
jgi:DNA-directed RNA polymerase II subunit RPB1